MSGPTTTTVHPDGSGMEIARGLNWFGFGPNSQANTGQPGLIFTSGLVDVKFANGDATSVTVAGTNTNGCDLLR